MIFVEPKYLSQILVGVRFVPEIQLCLSQSGRTNPESPVVQRWRVCTAHPDGQLDDSRSSRVGRVRESERAREKERERASEREKSQDIAASRATRGTNEALAKRANAHYRLPGSYHRNAPSSHPCVVNFRVQVRQLCRVLYIYIHI